MSRFQDVLKKAEREGTQLHTRGVGTEARQSDVPSGVPIATPLDAPHLRVVVDVRDPVTGLPPVGTTETLEPAEPVQAADLTGSAEFAYEGTVPEVGHVVAELRPAARLVALVAPQSPAAEQYRALRARLWRPENAHALRSLLVTSPGKGDGKTLTAANLAVTLSQEAQRHTVLVDADLRKPDLHHMFGLPDGPGLADVLAGTMTLDDVMVDLPGLHRLTLVPAGSVAMHPADLLGNAGMRRVVDTLRTRFDCVILDAPPALPVADASILGSFVDAVLLVVRAGLTQKPAIERSLGVFVPGKVLGLVLNDAEEPAASTYYGYGNGKR